MKVHHFLFFAIIFFHPLGVQAKPLDMRKPLSFSKKKRALTRWGKLYQKVVRSIYLVHCGTRKGAGFLYKDRHHIVTSLKVAGCGRQLWLQRYKAPKKWIRVELKAFISRSDIALLYSKVPLKDPPLFPVKHEEFLHIGQRIFLVGHPYKSTGSLDEWTQKVLSWSLTSGILGRLTRQYLQLNVPLMVGFSGAPILNERGEILGVLTTLGPQGLPIGVAARIAMLDKLFRKDPPPQEGYPFLAWSVQVHARFSYALGDTKETKISPSNQELRLDLIFWDQMLLGLFVGFDLLSLRADLDLSLLFGLDLGYRVLMPRLLRPYLNYVSIGMGAMAMQVNILVSKAEEENQKQKTNNYGLLAFDGLLRVTFWGGIRLFSLIGQFSIGLFFDIQDLRNPVLSFSWGIGS